MAAIVKENISLKPYNTFGIVARARYFSEVTSVMALQILLPDATWMGESKLILGSGSNILFTQDFNGLVIHNKISGIELIEENIDHVFLKIGAGENWHKLVLYCIQNNYAGIENLSLIPGTVGAAPIQNIGAYGVELKDVLHEVHAIDIEKKLSRIFSCKECKFRYRDSIFKNALKNKFIVTHVILRLNKKPVFHIEYGAIKEKLAGQEISIHTISDTIIKIRQEKLPNPAKIPNAGSFFKNPIISEEIFLILQKKYPEIPYFIDEKNNSGLSKKDEMRGKCERATGVDTLVNEDCERTFNEADRFLRKHSYKIPAAWLIEQCGFKGKRFGNVGVHEHQALVLVNYGDGTGDEIKKLSELIQKTVLEKFGIVLATEVNIV